MALSISRNGLETQYHHFIPQFILRKFSNYDQLLAEGTKPRKAKQYAKVWLLNLENGALERKSTSKRFGVQDMYKETGENSHPMFEVEEMLSGLEQKAARTLSRIESAFKNGKSSFIIGRLEKDELRKFLFIMLYRSRTFHNRYEKSKAAYNANDRELMMDYMSSAGFDTPKAVWLANIRTFINIRLGFDTERWSTELLRGAYPPDAKWFINHLLGTFMSFCTPAHGCTDNFILTQNAYGVFEGPYDKRSWTNWHVFAPMTPQIMIVMRQQDLQKNIELPIGISEALESFRQAKVSAIRSVHNFPGEAKSFLEDLPLERPETSYPTILPAGRSDTAPFSNDDTYTFKFINLSPKELQRINSILLEEASCTESIVFQSEEALRKSLEAYFLLDPIRFKQVASRPETSTYKTLGYARLSGWDRINWQLANCEKYLRTLEKAAVSLGSSVRPLYIDRSSKYLKWLMSSPNIFLERYEKLGGSSVELAYDMFQADCITNLVTMSDRFMSGMSAEFKYTVRQHRREIINNLPARRVWLHARQLQVRRKKGMKFDVIDELMEKVPSDETNGAEVALVDAVSIFNHRDFVRILYNIWDLEVFLSDNPSFGMSGKSQTGETLALQLRQERAVVFDKPGSIMRCGIPRIQAEARRIFLSESEYHIPDSNSLVASIISENQQLELRLRNVIYGRLETILGARLTPTEISGLKSALFGKLYRLNLTRS